MDKLIIVSEAFNVLFDDSEDEDDNFQTKIEKNENYAKEVVPSFSNKTFKQHFRMNPNVFESVCKNLHSHLGQEYGPGRKALGIDKQLMITLWYLGSKECLRSISERFGVSISTSWKTVSSVCDALLKTNGTKKFIKWPTPEEAAKTSMHYFSKYKLQGVIGCIDSSHIQIRAPKRCRKSYINRKGEHSILLQGLCNHKMEFLYCYTGECGSFDNALLMKRSGLESKLNSGHFSITTEQHVLGNCTYPLKQWLITPFHDNGYLRDEQNIFNTVHSECRIVIQRAFGLLKGRFQRLFFIDCLRPVAIVKFVIASCILHNICLQNQDTAEEFIVIPTNEEDENENNTEPNAEQSATLKRDQIMSLLF